MYGKLPKKPGRHGLTSPGHTRNLIEGSPMASKKKNNDDGLLMAAIAMAAVLMVFSVYHFIRFKRQYASGDRARRVFDMGNGWRAILETGLFAVVYGAVSWALYREYPASLFLTVPLGLFVFNWLAKVQARVFLGVVVDYDRGEVMFMNSPSNLDITDYLMVLPVFRNYGSFDRLALADVQWITRQAGKSLFLHGDFGSRRIDFSNKLKRDECIHLVTSGEQKRIRVASDFGE